MTTKRNISKVNREGQASHESRLTRIEANVVALTKRGVFDPTPLIKQLVDAKGWSQAEFGRRLNMTPGRINQLMTGRRGWTVKPLAQISEVLNVPIGYFFGQKSDFEELTKDLKELLDSASSADLELVKEMLRRLQDRK